MHADSTAIDTAIATAVAAVVTRRDAFIDALLTLFAAEISPLQHDDEFLGLLAASTEENVVTALHLLQHGLAAETIDPPAAALQYARRLAQRSVPLSALLRSYRLGHARFLEALLQALSAAPGIEPVVAGAAGVARQKPSFCRGRALRRHQPIRAAPGRDLYGRGRRTARSPLGVRDAVGPLRVAEWA